MKYKQNKITKLLYSENRPLFDWRGCNLGEESQNVKTPSYKINKSWGCNVEHGDYS